MADVKWLLNRLQAMSIPEVIWRVSQRLLQKREEKQFKAKPSAVGDRLFNDKLNSCSFQPDLLFLNYENKNFTSNKSIRLLGDFDYNIYKTQWNSGFQTKSCWDNEFSYSLEYKQRDDIGDARTNWELNRHFQLALIAKNYMASGDKKYLNEFTELFNDWNDKNPFLYGISWTSVMETAIRCSNWCYALAFLLKAGDAPEDITKRLETGILNMTDYISKHYSRYSSANNHLIVEAYAVCQSGIVFGYKPWIALGIKILTEELPLQNYSDGINKELSLHYQSFYMEAMGLALRLLIKNKIEVPPIWYDCLDKMCRYMADCMGEYGEAVVFGDDDEGKILDLQGGHIDHYKYVLGLFSIMLNKKFTDIGSLSCENLNWLFTEKERLEADQKEKYASPLNVCRREGGVTLLRSNDRKILIGIDHGELGFGSIAAHGHADALSFQLFCEGQPVFVDPGTYIYHCDLENRNYFRKTENHNTVSINNRDQSEMLGAFLWGKRAECSLEEYGESDDNVVLKASHNGYEPCVHSRRFEFDKKSTLRITDEFSESGVKYINFIFAPHIRVEINNNTAVFASDNINGKITFSGKCKAVEKQYSPGYGVKCCCRGLSIETDEKMSEAVIEIY